MNIPNFSEIEETTVLSEVIKGKVPPLREVRWVFFVLVFGVLCADFWSCFYQDEEVGKNIKWVVNDIYSRIQEHKP